jgi:hypothetical protein
MKLLLLLVVMVGALTLTALGIDAADTWRGASGTLLGQVIGSERNQVCSEGMSEVPTAQTFRCIDRYEASASADCPVANPTGPRDTEANIAASSCRPESREGVTPWRFVAREQAARLCARVGKRLPTAAEWYDAARDTPDRSCVHGVLHQTGSHGACRSAVGAFDMVGNLWEWVADDVFDGQWEGRVLPASGYVAQVDRAGIATLTSATSSAPTFEDAYFWSLPLGAFGMIRGGFYGSYDDAGVAAVHAATVPTFTGEAVGFRCVR